MHEMLYLPGNSMTESARGPALAWRKSTYSVKTDCVVVASNGRDVLIRDSAAPESLALRLPAGAWRAFLAATLGL